MDIGVDRVGVVKVVRRRCRRGKDGTGQNDAWGRDVVGRGRSREQGAEPKARTMATSFQEALHDLCTGVLFARP